MGARSIGKEAFKFCDGLRIVRLPGRLVKCVVIDDADDKTH